MKWFLLILGGGAAMLAFSNWQKCTTSSYAIGPNGQVVPVDASGNIIGVNPCIGAPSSGVGSCSVGTKTIQPPLSCLFNPNAIFPVG